MNFRDYIEDKWWGEVSNLGLEFEDEEDKELLRCLETNIQYTPFVEGLLVEGSSTKRNYVYFFPWHKIKMMWNAIKVD